MVLDKAYFSSQGFSAKRLPRTSIGNLCRYLEQEMVLNAPATFFHGLCLSVHVRRHLGRWLWGRRSQVGAFDPWGDGRDLLCAALFEEERWNNRTVLLRCEENEQR